MSDDRLARARATRNAARDDLQATMAEIQVRLEPSRLLDDAMTEVRQRSGALAEQAKQAAQERPAAVAATGAAALLLLLRRPLARLGRKWLHHRRETTGAE